jgi:hypothetical protein
MLWIELIKVDKLKHKIYFKLFFLSKTIYFKLFFLSKTACANTNLLEQ